MTSPEKVSGKKTYQMPKLSQYGTLTEMTAGKLTTANGDNGGKDPHKTV